MVPAELPPAWPHYTQQRRATNPEGRMQRSYYGLPAAPSLEQAIIRAQLLILKAYERGA